MGTFCLTACLLFRTLFTATLIPLGLVAVAFVLNASMFERAVIWHTRSAAIIAGDVDYLEPPSAAPGAEEALICCSYPRPSAETDHVVLNI